MIVKALAQWAFVSICGVRQLFAYGLDGHFMRKDFNKGCYG